jgi:hypothetical protein
MACWAVSVLSNGEGKVHIFSTFKTKYMPLMISELLGVPLVTRGATDRQVVTIALSFMVSGIVASQTRVKRLSHDTLF